MFCSLLALLACTSSSTVLKQLHSNEEVKSLFITNLLQPYDGEVLFHPSFQMQYPHFAFAPRFQFITPNRSHLITRETHYTLSKEYLDLEFIGFCNITAASENSFSLMVFDTELSPDTISPSIIPLVSFGPQGLLNETLQVFLRVIVEINDTVEDRVVRLTTPPTITFNDGRWHHYKFTFINGIATLYFDNAPVCEVPANFTDTTWTFVDGNPAMEAKLPPHPTITAVSLRGHRGDAIISQNDTEAETNNTMEVVSEICINCGRLARRAVSKQFNFLALEPKRAIWIEKQRRYEAEREDIRIQLKQMPPRNVTFVLRKAFVNSLLHQYLLDRYSKFTVVLICLSFITSCSLVIVSSFFLLQEQDKRIKQQQEEAKVKTEKQGTTQQAKTTASRKTQVSHNSSSSTPSAWISSSKIQANSPAPKDSTPRQRISSPFPKGHSTSSGH